MSNLQELYNAHKEREKIKREEEAKQKRIEALEQQKRDAEQKEQDRLNKAKQERQAVQAKVAEAVREQARLKDPKYQKKLAKQQQRAEKKRIASEKKEVKRLAKVDKMLTKIFNRLSADDKTSLNSLINNDGNITQTVGGFNTFGEYLKRGFGYGVTNIGALTKEDIERNQAFQNYKKKLDEQGFDLIVESAHGGENALEMKFATTGLTFCSGVVSTIMPVVGIPLGLVTFACVGMSDMAAANFTLKIQEKQPIFALEDKRSEQEKAAAALNTITGPAPQKQELNIIR